MTEKEMDEIAERVRRMSNAEIKAELLEAGITPEVMADAMLDLYIACKEIMRDNPNPLAQAMVEDYEKRRCK